MNYYHILHPRDVQKTLVNPRCWLRRQNAHVWVNIMFVAHVLCYNTYTVTACFKLFGNNNHNILRDGNVRSFRVSVNISNINDRKLPGRLFSSSAYTYIYIYIYILYAAVETLQRKDSVHVSRSSGRCSILLLYTAAQNTHNILRVHQTWRRRTRVAAADPGVWNSTKTHFFFQPRTGVMSVDGSRPFFDGIRHCKTYGNGRL